MSCGVGRRHGSDLAWLWLWWRLAAVAPIQPLAWEPPYAAGEAQEIATTTTKDKKTKRQKKKKKFIKAVYVHCRKSDIQISKSKIPFFSSLEARNSIHYPFTFFSMHNIFT